MPECMAHIAAFLLNPSGGWVVFDARIGTCVFNRDQVLYNLLTFTTTFLLPTSVCAACYTRVRTSLRLVGISIYS